MPENNIPQQEAIVKKLYPQRHFEKRVCFNCDNYRRGLCDVREVVDMERGADSCHDWTAKE